MFITYILLWFLHLCKAQWKHTICVCLRLLNLLNMIISSCIHFPANHVTSFSFIVRDTPLGRHTIYHYRCKESFQTCEISENFNVYNTHCNEAIFLLDTLNSLCKVFITVHQDKIEGDLGPKSGSFFYLYFSRISLCHWFGCIILCKLFSLSTSNFHICKHISYNCI